MAEHPISQMTNAHTPTFGLSPGPIPEVHAFWLAGMSCDGVEASECEPSTADCDDRNGSIPGTEICGNEVDEDCNGSADEC